MKQPAAVDFDAPPRLPIRKHSRALVVGIFIAVGVCAALVCLESPVARRGNQLVNALNARKQLVPAGNLFPKEIAVFRGTEKTETQPFVVADDWELRWEFRLAPVMMTVDRFEEYVTLDQIAAIVSQKESTVEKWRSDLRDPMPLPDASAAGGNAAKWRWTAIRPWLEAKARRPLTAGPMSEQSFATYVIEHPGTIGRTNFGRGGKYVVTFAPFPGNEGPWKFEVVQLTNRID